MTFRSPKLLKIAREAPCMLALAVDCSNNPSVGCHSDLLRHGRGVGYKSGDQFAVAGCPACHELFTRKHLGEKYEQIWQIAHERYLTWLFENEHLRVV